MSFLSSQTRQPSYHSLLGPFQQPIFVKEPTGQPRKQKYIMGKRNWCRVEWDEQNGEMEFDIRVEREKGCGVTTGWVFFPFHPVWWDMFVNSFWGRVGIRCVCLLLDGKSMMAAFESKNGYRQDNYPFFCLTSLTGDCGCRNVQTISPYFVSFPFLVSRFSFSALIQLYVRARLIIHLYLQYTPQCSQYSIGPCVLVLI